jgi:hypothetical protein
MHQPDPLDVLVLGSGTVEKLIAWTSKPDGHTAVAKAEVDRWLLP